MKMIKRMGLERVINRTLDYDTIRSMKASRTPETFDSIASGMRYCPFPVMLYYQPMAAGGEKNTMEQKLPVYHTNVWED